MRSTQQPTLDDAHTPGTAAAPNEQMVTIPAGRRPVPTHTRLHTRRVPVVMYVAALLLIPGLVVAGFMSAGLWATTGKATIEQAETTGEEVHTGPAAPADPADVKGSMTVQQVIDAFPKITAEQIAAQFNAPADTPTSTQLKTLVEDSNGMDLPALRIWIQKHAAG